MNGRARRSISARSLPRPTMNRKDRPRPSLRQQPLQLPGQSPQTFRSRCPDAAEGLSGQRLYREHRRHHHRSRHQSPLADGGSDYPLPWQKAPALCRRIKPGAFCRPGQLATAHGQRTSQPGQAGGTRSKISAPTRCSTGAMRWLWSCDRRSAAASWYVSMDMGFVAWQDHSCCYYVRAVSSLENL